MSFQQVRRQKLPDHYLLKMKTKFYFAAIVTLTLFINGCKKEVDTDQEKPIIDIGIDGAFPVDCDTLYFGETFTFKVRFADNAELGSTNAFNIDIHHNFDQHSHSTSGISCDLDPIKSPNNPYVYIQSFDIPEDVKEYIAELPIDLPKGNTIDDFEEGDYHFQIRVADKEGWSTMRGMSIKILHR